MLAVYAEDAPYADHTSHACVSQCPAGQAADDQKDCQSKLYYTRKFVSCAAALSADCRIVSIQLVEATLPTQIMAVISAWPSALMVMHPTQITTVKVRSAWRLADTSGCISDCD